LVLVVVVLVVVVIVVVVWVLIRAIILVRGVGVLGRGRTSSAVLIVWVVELGTVVVLGRGIVIVTRSIVLAGIVLSRTVVPRASPTWTVVVVRTASWGRASRVCAKTTPTRAIVEIVRTIVEVLRCASGEKGSPSWWCECKCATHSRKAVAV